MCSALWKQPVRWVAILAISLAARAPGEEVEPYQLIDNPMWQITVFEKTEKIKRFSPRMLDLWLAALAQPDAETRCQAINAINRAHIQGMPLLEERSGNRLIQMMRDRSEHRAVRLAATRAIVQMDIRRAGDEMLQVNQDGDVEMITITDPALAKWKQNHAADLWLERLTDTHTSVIVRGLAMQSLATVGDQRGVDPIASYVWDHSHDDIIRLKAARALAMLVDQGLESRAQQLCEASHASIADRLIAVAVLGSHRSSLADQLRLQLIDDPEPAVVALAMQPLHKYSAQTLWPKVHSLLISSDAAIRRTGLSVLDAVHSAESIKYMVRMLTDQDPRNRTTARLMLHHASRDSLLSPTVHVELMNLLDGKNLFGKEQSAVLLGRLQYQLATERLVAMLRSPDLSDRLAAIVGLRWMGDRRTLPIVFDRARELISQWPRDIRRTRTVGMSMELSQMLQMFGALQYRDEEVDRFMKRFIPQRASLYSSRARAAAIWSLGRIYEGERDEELAMLLLARLLDVRIGFSEHDSIRQHAVMALGRMEVGDIPVPALQSTIEEIIYNIVIQRNTLGKVQLACRWAVRRMTNRPIPPLPPEFEISSSWFLSPVGRPR